MRLIDADTLKKSIVCSDTDELKVLSTKQLHKILDKWIDDRETVDIVPIIQCKDCKYSDTFDLDTVASFPLKCLGYRYGGVYPDWYCEHAEVKEGVGV